MTGLLVPKRVLRLCIISPLPLPASMRAPPARAQATPKKPPHPGAEGGMACKSAGNNPAPKDKTQRGLPPHEKRSPCRVMRKALRPNPQRKTDGPFDPSRWCARQDSNLRPSAVVPGVAGRRPCRSLCYASRSRIILKFPENALALALQVSTRCRGQRHNPRTIATCCDSSCKGLPFGFGQVSHTLVVFLRYTLKILQNLQNLRL